MAEWKRISNSSRYEVSSDGDIKNIETGRILKPQRSKGYLHVALCEDGVCRQRNVHRIVAEEFIPNHLGLDQVNHIDGNKENNRSDNLEWCTGSDNMKHAYKIGLQKPIPSQIKESLSRSLEVRKRPVRNIETGMQYESVAECARAEHLAHSAVSFHLAGKAKKCRYEYIDKGGRSQ